MRIGDVIRLRPNYRYMIGYDSEFCPLIGTITRVNRIGNLDILMSNGDKIVGVMRGNVELITSISEEE